MIIFDMTKQEVIEKSKNDIFYFVENILQIKLSKYQEKLLQKIIELKNSGDGEIVIYGGDIIAGDFYLI